MTERSFSAMFVPTFAACVLWLRGSSVLQAFFKKYNYKHEVLCIAADEPSSVAFSFVADTVSFVCLFSPVL